MVIDTKAIESYRSFCFLNDASVSESSAFALMFLAAESLELHEMLTHQLNQININLISLDNHIRDLSASISDLAHS